MLSAFFSSEGHTTPASGLGRALRLRVSNFLPPPLLTLSLRGSSPFRWLPHPIGGAAEEQRAWRAR